ALRSLDAHITTRCYGYTASAATIIAQAASPGCREISANALYLIHTAICAAEGTAAEIAGKLDLLRQTDTRIAAVYAARSGRPAGEFEALMAENNGNGRWLSPEEAVAAGLADTVTDNEERTAPSLAGNIARGWERLLAGIGLNRREELPADRNVLLTAGERQELLRRSATAIRQAQQNASPTCTKPREDPSYGDTVRTANQRAYAEDAKRFKGI
ncbi:Clp protease ClpP, partial [Enterobacter hormaechei]|nr:Clp protease ClpP [Enterobacter hormaechei]